MYVSAALKGFLIAVFSLVLVACGNDEKKQAQEITAKLPGTTTLQVHASSLSVAQGQTVTIDVHYIDSVGLKADVAAAATYNLGDSRVLTQGSSPNSFTAVGGGTTTIEVSYQGKTETLTIQVTPTLVSKVDIELNQSATTAVGQKGQFRAIAYFADGTHDDISDRVRWESSNSLVLAFEGAGSRFVALSSGTSFISVVVPESVGVLTLQGAKPGAGGGDNTPTPSTAPSSSTYSIEVTVSDVGISDLHLHSSAGSKLVPGESTSMTANAVHSDGTVFNFSSTVSWSSSDSSVATITDQGKVVAVGAGAATITATHAGFSTTYAITVDAVTATALDIHLTTGTDVNLNGSQRLTVSAEYSDGSSRDVTSLVAWSSDDTTVLTVGNGGSLAGEVRGVGSGSATISAVLDGLSSSVTLTVLDEQPSGLIIRQVGGTIFEGNILSFQAFAQFDSGREDNVTKQVTWSSSRSDVLNISNASGHEGEAHALVAGAAKISVAYKNYRAELSTVVESAAVTALALSPTSVNLGEGKDAQIKVTATYANGATSDVTRSASYSPQTSGVVTVHNGTVHGVAAGRSEVTIQFSGKSATLSVDVHAAALQSLLISIDKASLEVNQHAQLTATGTLDNGLQVSETSNVKWTSTDLHVATVDSHGRLVAHGAGTAIIHASLSSVTSNDISITVSAAPPASGGSGTALQPAGSGTASASGTVTTSTSHTGAITASTLPTLKNFAFAESASKTIPGTSAELHAGANNCDGTVKSEDSIGQIAILARQQAGVSNPSCWTDGGYNFKDFPVKQGTLSSASGDSYEAYVVGKPASPTNFAASGHYIAYKPAAVGTFDIYEFDGHFTKIGSITATSTDWQYTDIEASKITTSRTLVFVPSGDPAPSVLHAIASDLNGAQLASNPIGDIYHYELAISGGRTPLDLSEFTAGPADHGNRYGQNRYFHLVELSSGNLGIVWQDRNDYKIYLTKFDRRGTSTTVDLPSGSGNQYMLGAAASDGAGSIYYIVFEAGNKDPNYTKTSDPHKVLSVMAIKSDENGASLAARELNDSTNSLNATTFGDIATSTTATDGQYGNTVSLRVAGSEVGIIYSRLHAQTGDGLNHQGADAIVLNASDLTLKVNHGQTSGHSFSNVMEVTSSNQFIAIDLGDNYPRGVHFHRFDGATKNQRVVYTFKTHHGYVASHDGRGPFDPYGVDVTGKQMYKWSNDNNTYTELGGVAEVSDGYLVVFASEHDANLRVLNNNSTGDNLNLIDPRNIGFIKVAANFQAASGSGNVVTDDLIATQGGSSAETGEFYSFDGIQQDQRVTGIRWLTSYTDKATENASRIRLRDRADGNFLVMWEKWQPSSYVSTHAMVIDANGTVVTQDTEVSGVRLNRRDDLIRIGNRTYAVVANRTSRSFEITEIEE